jgi:hypothetical protein
MHIDLHGVPVPVVQLKSKLEYIDKLQLKLPVSYFTKICSTVLKFMHTDGLVDGRSSFNRWSAGK